MSQQFETEVMADLAAAASRSSAGDAARELERDGFEDDGAMSDSAMSEEMSDVTAADADAEESRRDRRDTELGAEAFANGVDDATDAGEPRAHEAWEDVMAEALDADDADQFFARLLSLLHRPTNGVGRGAGPGGRAEGTDGRVASQAGRGGGPADKATAPVDCRAGRADRSTSPTASRPHEILSMLQHYASQGFDEMEAFDDIAEWFAEDELDEALPILAVLTARTLVRPLERRASGQLTRPVARQLVRGATQAARTLVQQWGPLAVRALPRIAGSVARTAVRRRVPVTAWPQAVQRTAARVARQPQLVRRLASPVAGVTRPGLLQARTQQWRLRGPVQITVTTL